MVDKLKELTEKLYKEGIKEGQEKADEIISSAKVKSKEIIEGARKEGEEIIEKANRDAHKIKETVTTELKLTSQQIINFLKTEITNLLLDKTFEGADKITNTDLLQKMTLTLMESWTKNKQQDLALELPKEYEKDFDKFIKTSCKKYLDKGAEISFGDNIKSGFIIKAKDSSYKIEFTEESFISFYKEHLKPLTKKLLFQDN